MTPRIVADVALTSTTTATAQKQERPSAQPEVTSLSQWTRRYTRVKPISAASRMPAAITALRRVIPGTTLSARVTASHT